MAGTTSGVKFSQRGDDHDLTLYQGKTVNFSLIWGGSDPIDITGYDARMDIRSSASEAAAEAEFNVGNGRVTVGTTDGLIRVTMSATDSAELTAGDYVYDIEVIDDSGNVFLGLSGRCEIVAEVTR